MKCFALILLAFTAGGCCSFASRPLAPKYSDKAICIYRPEYPRWANDEVEACLLKRLQDAGIQARIVQPHSAIKDGELQLYYRIRRGWVFWRTVSWLKISVEDPSGEIVAFANFRQKGGLFSVFDICHKWRGPEYQTERLLDILTADLKNK